MPHDFTRQEESAGTQSTGQPTFSEALASLVPEVLNVKAATGESWAEIIVTALWNKIEHVKVIKFECTQYDQICLINNRYRTKLSVVSGLPIIAPDLPN